MAGGRKTINRRFVLYSEMLLEDYKAIRVFIILIHLVSLLLGVTGLIIGVFAYSAEIGTSPLPFVNCSLSLQFQAGPHFPVQLQLILTGIGLIAIDVSTSLLLCAIKKLSCGLLAIVWFVGSAVCVTGWTVWAVLYSAMVFPLWEADRQSCDDLVMISQLVGTALMVFFCVLDWLIIVVTIVKECWYRCDIECVCSCQRRGNNNDFDDY